MQNSFVPWPESFADAYRQRGYWSGTPLGTALDRSFLANGERIAIVEGDRRITYRELRQSVERIARHLVERGLQGGARVLFQLPNIHEFVVLYVACLKVGAVPVTCLPHHRRAEMTALARASSASALFICSSFRGFDYVAMAEQIRAEVPGLREVWVVGDSLAGDMTLLAKLLEPAPDPGAVDPLPAMTPRASEPAVFQLSGGTTGVPKLIPRTHDDYLYNSLQFAAASGFDRDSVLLVPIPVAHNFPLACPGVQGALLLGARVVLAPSPAPDVVFPLIEREKVTWIPAVPATVIQWTERAGRSGHDFGSLRALYVGGQRLLPESAAAAIDVFGPVVRQVYGMAEGLLCCTRPGDPAAWHLETQGRPISPGDELRVVDEAGRDVVPGEVGEILCRGPYTIRGYFHADGHNREVFTEDGFYRTGDLARAHPSGNLVIEGRRKDVINRGGEKIAVEEVENLILSHPAVRNAAVVAMPDSVLGERACACVVLNPDLTLDLPELRRFLEHDKHISPTKLPERLELMSALPATGVGKTSKKELREIVRNKIEAEMGTGRAGVENASE